MPQQLWFLRHGEAEPHGSAPDAERPLTPRGERQATGAGEALSRLGLELAACYTSPKVRAAETARLACAALGVEAELADALASGLAADALGELTSGHDGNARLLFVGHEPDLSQAVLDLTGGRVDFKKGGIAAVRMAGPRGSRGELLVLLRPRELETLAGSA